MEELACKIDDHADMAGSYWVGIGASAGGLEALRALSRHLPEDAEATYIVTQHMAPQYKSMMTELVARETPLRVLDIVDGLEPLPNHIYITPPNQDLIVEGDRLRLIPPSTEPGAPKPSVNRFFRSLATERGDRAVGIILSGTGSDGAYGIQAIRAAGGITIAQSESTAKYDGMPNAAIESGAVDLIMSPNDIGTKFDQIIRLPRDLESLRHQSLSGDDLGELMHLLLAKTQVDFRDYKLSTVHRRIERRMASLRIETLAEYVNHAREHEDEVLALFRDLLISVTSFFRDVGEFEALERQLAETVEAKEEKRLRVWIAGCATGEEAYSIAILAAEALGGFANIEKSALQIFATDIDEAAIDRARNGLYPEAALNDLPAAYVERYFHKCKEGFQVGRRLREAVMFAYHDATRDPPFRHIDLVSCRNMLIYFRQSLQERVLSRFHYALNPKGLLFLGKSENVSGSSEMFRAIGDDRRIFEKRGVSCVGNLGSLDYQPHTRPTRFLGNKRDNQGSGPDMGAMFDALVKAVGPNCLLATPNLNLKRAYGDVTRYLGLTEGDIDVSVPSLLHSDYAQEVRTLISACQRHNETRFGLIRADETDPGRYEQTRVYPIEDHSTGQFYVLIAFAEWRQDQPKGASLDEAPEAAKRRISDLERVLGVTRESLQQANEELENSNEELQALNEELQSSNEELQATNEELQTSNEELQSTNEELSTVNEQLQISGQELSIANRDLDSILTNVGMPFVVVDRDLAVTRSSAEARRFLGLDRPEGRPEVRPHVSLCTMPKGFPRLIDLVAEVLKTGRPIERHVIGESESANLALTAYHSGKDQVAGVVAVISPTSELNQAKEAFEVSEKRLDLAVQGAGVGLWDWDIQSDALFWSDRFKQILGVDDSGFSGKVDAFFDRLHPGDKERVTAAIDAHLKDHKPYDSQYRIRHEDGSYRWIEARGQAIWGEDGRPRRFLGSVDDITERRQNEVALKFKTEQMVLAERMAGIGHWRLDLADRSLVWSDQVFAIHGETLNSFTPTLDDAIDFYHWEDRDKVRRCIEIGMERGRPFEFEARIVRRSGEVRTVQSSCCVERDQDKVVVALFGVFSDVTEHRRHEQERQETLNELARSNAELSRFSYVCSHDMKEPVRTLSTMADLLLDRDSPPDEAERQDLLRRISKNAERLSGIIESLLAYSRVDGKLTIESVDLNEIIAEIRESLDIAIEEARAEIEVASLPIVQGAKVHFRQLFQNVIGNSLKFAKPDECQIRITSEGMDHSWRISIDDNGPGVPESERKAIFEVFKRLNRVDQIPGSGLGLSICRKILNQYRGTITCEASDLGGASMVIILPKDTG